MPESILRKLAAIMFTDMVGYTALMQEDEALARVKRMRHRAVIESLHNQFQGEILQYYGDGTLSIFKSVICAVECAIEIQRKLSEPPEVALRIGIHLGEIVQEEDGVYGDSVNLASRVESFSVPGAVLITEHVYRAIHNQPHLQTKSLGQFIFKNVKQPVEIYALTNESLVIPARNDLQGKGYSFDTDKIALPQQLTSFIGRKEEIGEVCKLILQSRLVTLTGPGGTGKTRLALKVAEQLSDQFEHGLCWIPLASVTLADSVSLAIAKALDIIQDPSKNMASQLIDYLKQKSMLLVLDNFEQIIEAAPVIWQILSHCPGVKAMVTSRIVLHIQGEQEYPVHPLEVPMLNGKHSIAYLQDIPSVDLFCQRAKAVKPGFNLNDQNVAAIVNICHRLDGLPLAIELAAARIKIFSPDALLKRLDDHLDLLKADSPDRPERHHTLRHAISWSYELLPYPERELFHRLSVFAGGCDLEAIEAVCSGENGEACEAVDLVLALVDKSLLNRKEDDYGELRFYMLETIRAFAYEALERQDNPEAVQKAHAIYFVSKAEKAEPHLTGPDQARWMSSLEADLDNLRDAINWTMTNREFELALRLGMALGRLWYCRNMLTEGVNLAWRLLNWQTPVQFSRLRAKIAEGLIATYFYTGDHPDALVLCKENLAFWRTDGDVKEISNGLNHLGFACINAGLVQEGIQHTHEALEMHKHRGDLRGEAVSYNNLGWAYHNKGTPRIALPVLEQSLELRKKIKDERGIGFAMVNLARSKAVCRDLPEALSLIQEGIAIIKSNKDKVVHIWGIINLAQLHYEMGNMDEFKKLLQDNSDIISNASLVFILHGCHNYFKGILATNIGSFTEADNWIEKGIVIFRERQMVHFVNKGWYYRSKIAFDSGKFDLALGYLKSSLEINTKYDIQVGFAENLEFASVLFAKTGELENAALLLSKAGAMRAELGAPTPPVMVPYVQATRKILEQKFSPEKLALFFENGRIMNRDQTLELVKTEISLDNIPKI